MKRTIQQTEPALTPEKELNVAIGYEVSQLLNLKFGKDGRTNTSWGTKSIEGLGACITRIVEEQTKRLNS
jgi:hypothetical protein